jgi:hypothetical protein
MSYTTVDQVAAMFPAFIRGGANQKPSDNYIEIFIDDVAGELDAILARRFGDLIASVAPASSPATSLQVWVGTLPSDAINVLEKLNRYGAAVQLGETLASFGVAGTRDLAKSYAAQYDRMFRQLDARDDRGRPLASGPYDKLFNPLARTETAEPALEGIAGGDMPTGVPAAEEGLSNFFGKFDKRGT